ncbi:MAG: metal ABC transporter permease [Oscillospiraceae bacterium]|nr:metal ABC transporter permease [Oscillospiraceae bacterium]MBQ4311077.1 metal ABC transporter permease [Oscillospiraceae bacterium]
MELIYDIMDKLMPFEFMKYTFMKNSFLAILIATPIFAILGTMVVNKKMAFFSDAIGHSALCGIAVGTVFGFTDRSLSMVIFAVIFSMLLNYVKDRTTYGADTIISVFASVAMSLGLVLLSAGGSFNKYTSYLVGDILSITAQEIAFLAVCFVLVIVFWLLAYNKLSAASINRTLAKSKGINGLVLDYLYSAFIAVVIMFSIRWIGVLLINSLIILPAASSRNISYNTRQYHLFSVLISLVPGIAGLIISYYTGTPTGPMIVLMLGAIFFVTFVIHSAVKK